MKGKFKSFALAAVLGIVGIFSALGLSGCGASLKDLKTEYTSMQDQIKKYSVKEGADGTNTGFFIDNVDGIVTNLFVDFGEKINNRVNNSSDTGFNELRTKYNSILVISNDYITQNIVYIQNYKEKNMSKSAKKALKTLCDDMKDFTKYIKTFAEETKNFAKWYELFENADKKDIDNSLITYKKSFGKLVAKNLDVSMSLAKCVEKTEIYDSLKKTEVTQKTLTIIHGYTRAKMLPIFSKFMLTETTNKFVWENYKNGNDDTKKVDEILTKLTDIYNGQYKSNFVKNFDPQNTNKNVKALFNMVDEFLKEADSYMDALGDLDLYKFAVTYKADMSDYLKHNKLANIDIHKIEQFVEITLPGFISEFSSAIN